MAFNSKNLHYEKQEPAFLRRLRGEHGSDRQNVQFARPNKSRLKTGDEDDAPTMVDEEGENVSKEEYERMMKEKEKEEVGKEDKVGEDAGVGQKKGSEEVREDDEGKLRGEKKQIVVEAGAGTKKRKAVKVVGEEERMGDGLVLQGSKAQREKETDAVPVKQAGTKKKAKKIKLSFDEPE